MGRYKQNSLAAAAVGIAGLCMCLAGCGGRVSEPVPAHSAIDDRLDCDHLRAERVVNDARIKDLMGERDFSENNNVGLLLVSPLFLDLKDSEKQEIRALAERNRVLDELIKERCPK